MTLRVLGLLLVLSIGAHAQKDPSDHTRGSDLYHSCQAAIRVMDSNIRPDDLHDSEFCRGYITAFGEFNDMAGTAICLAGSTIGTTVRVYVAFMEKNPKFMDDMMIIGVVHALKETYPCPAPKQP
jgi:hypothetical protein